MKTLRLLNIAAILLLFTPFFQMCSDDEGDELSFVDTLPENRADSSSVQIAPAAQDSIITSKHAASEDQKSTLEEFWELITVPGDNFTTTAFGLFVITVFDVSEGHFNDIWIGSLFTIVSLCLTIATMIRLFKGRLDKLIPLLAINLSFILAAYVAAVLTFDSIAQVKWGYYVYLGTVSLLLLQARTSIAESKFSSDLATPA